MLDAMLLDPMPKLTPTPTRLAALAGLVLLVCALLVVPTADAATYIITLDNGNVFESRFQPSEASWDENMIMVMTDDGDDRRAQGLQPRRTRPPLGNRSGGGRNPGGKDPADEASSTESPRNRPSSGRTGRGEQGEIEK